MRDLWRWTRDPLSLLERGAAGEGSVFRLRLWRDIFIGYRPEWNKAVLSDRDGPERGPSFYDNALEPVTQPMAVAVSEILPHHDFDALAWSREAVLAMLNAAFFGGTMPQRMLAAFLHPLKHTLPNPFTTQRIGQVLKSMVETAIPGTLAASLAGAPAAVEELRAALTTGYRATAHTLAWAIWLLGEHSRWQDPAALPRVIDEVLRLYPPQWFGTTVLSGSLVGYSPYLTHRDPVLWPDPSEFRPDRFDKSPEPWTYLPFGRDFDGQLTRRMLMTALVALCEKGLTAMRGDDSVRTSVTLSPAGPLWVIPGLRPQALFRRSVA